MLKLTSISQLSSRSALPPPYRPAVEHALQNLGPDLTARGFVLFVERNDTLAEINNCCSRDISTSLEGTFIDGNCLIGVVLWGSSGEGVTIVCPNVDDYADEVADVLRKYL